ncbi:hypothetical protein PoB_001794800 [Plakobranchus ocellatus]|uniref:Uncharacterized protein n=1 Tax=Plakobranchus ocellatus TaxID=259542 RepID=A0AAV3Z9K2_9GAST|nr:hypothetical protein PoB_001794800 [Plakobranchus ocellatus]
MTYNPNARRSGWACSTTAVPQDAAISLWLALVVARPTKLFSETVSKWRQARGTSRAVVKESTVLSYSSDKKAGHARTSILVLSLPSSLSGGISAT